MSSCFNRSVRSVTCALRFFSSTLARRSSFCTDRRSVWSVEISSRFFSLTSKSVECCFSISTRSLTDIRLRSFVTSCWLFGWSVSSGWTAGFSVRSRLICEVRKRWSQRSKKRTFQSYFIKMKGMFDEIQLIFPLFFALKNSLLFLDK